MQYKCPQCGFTSEQAGNCPTCNVPLVEVKDEAAPAPQAPQEPSQTPTSENQ